jgi:hypothetical protein
MISMLFDFQCNDFCNTWFNLHILPKPTVFNLQQKINDQIVLEFHHEFETNQIQFTIHKQKGKG